MDFFEKGFMMMKKRVKLELCLVCVFALVSAAGAFTIDVDIDGAGSFTNIFQDDFESDTPQVGTYTERTGTTIVHGGTPGPYAGSGYAEFAVGVLRVALGDSSIDAVGDKFHFQCMVYTPASYSGEEAWQQFVGFDNSGTTTGVDHSPIHTMLDASGYINYYDGSAWVQSSAQVSYGEWQKWEVDYELGSGVWSMLIDGVGDTAMGLNSRSADEGIGSFVFFTNMASVGNPMFLDSEVVPEPATLGLISLGAVALVRRRKK